MLTVRPDDYILVGKLQRGSFIAYHQFVDDTRQYDDCESFLLKTTYWWHLDELDAAIMAARRLLTKLDAPSHRYMISKSNWWWADGFRVFPLESLHS